MRKIATCVAALLIWAVPVPASAAESVTDGYEALRESGLGWGAIAKLQGIASAHGLTAEELLVAVPVVDGNGELGIGEAMQRLDRHGRKELERQARNFSELTDAIAQDVADGADVPHGENGDDAPGKAALLADALKTEAENIMALRDLGVGWGAAFKLIRFSQVMGVPVDEILAATPEVDGEYDFAFGQLRDQLTEEQREALEDGPRSLGHVISADKRADKAEKKAANRDDKRADGKGHGRDKVKGDKEVEDRDESDDEGSDDQDESSDESDASGDEDD